MIIDDDINTIPVEEAVKILQEHGIKVIYEPVAIIPDGEYGEMKQDIYKVLRRIL